MVAFCIGGDDEDGLDEAFATVLCDQIQNAPLHTRLSVFGVDEVLGVEGLIIL
jgi:hypothetical protein